jgi:hypothetical protein
MQCAGERNCLCEVNQDHSIERSGHTIAVRRVPTATLADRAVATKAVAVSRPNLAMAMGHMA